MLEKDFISSPKSIMNLNYEIDENNHSIFADCELSPRNQSKDKIKTQKLIACIPDHEKLSKTTNTKKNHRKSNIIPTTHELLNSLPILRKKNNKEDFKSKSLAPERKLNLIEDIYS